MNIVKSAAAGVTAALMLATSASAVEVYVQQSEYVNFTPRQQMDFVTGVYDAHAVLLDADLIGNPRAVELLERGIRCSGTMSAADMRDVLNRYIANGSGKPTDAPASLLFFALAETC